MALTISTVLYVAMSLYMLGDSRIAQVTEDVDKLVSAVLDLL